MYTIDEFGDKYTSMKPSPESMPCTHLSSAKFFFHPS